MSLEQLVQVVYDFLLDAAEGLNRSSENLEKLSKMYEKLEKFCFNNNLENSEIFKKIREKVFCRACKEKKGAVLLSCHHFLCEICLKTSVLSQTKGLVFLNRFEQQLVPKCPVQGCAISIKQEKYEGLFQETSEKLRKSRKKREIIAKEINSQKNFCMICEKLRRPEYFFYPCKHVCLFCSSFDMNRSLRYCVVCYKEKFPNLEDLPSLSSEKVIPKVSSLLSQNPSSSFIRSMNQIKCHRCKDDQFFENLFLETCQDYILCLNCLKLFWLEGFCQKCDKSIQTHESFDLIRGHLFKTCENCGNSVPFDFILPLFCCSSMICMFCQVTFNLSVEPSQKNSCLNCKTSLEAHLIQSLDNLTELHYSGQILRLIEALVDPPEIFDLTRDPRIDFLISSLSKSI